MSIVISRRLSFQKPTVGAKHYLSIGASGWVETFPRKRVDAELKSYVGQLSICQLVDNFIEQMALADRKYETWSDVTGYLSRVFNVKADAVPMGVGIAFWGQVVMAVESKGSN
jgi:hypothetical protein